MHPADITASLIKVGSSQSKLARKNGIKPQTVYGVIHGSIVSYPTAKRIAKTIDKPIAKIWPGKYDHRLAA